MKCHGRSVEGSQPEAELQDGEGDIQTIIWLNIKEEAASVLQRVGTDIPPITLLPGGLRAGETGATCKASGT